jgi:hypothetical protein
MNLTQSSITAIGNWRGAVGVPLRTALHVSMDVCGRDGAEACKHALILMAQSAGALTKQAKPLRKVEMDDHGREFTTWYKQPRGTKTRRYAFQYRDDVRRDARGRYNGNGFKGSFELQGRRIAGRGLAKRSWRWSLSQLGSKQSPGRPIPGVNTVHAMRAPWRNGYQMRNKLSYILPIMPAGWQQTVETKAGNKIMAQAAKKLENKWRAAVGAPKSATISRPDLAAMFSASLRAA